MKTINVKTTLCVTLAATALLVVPLAHAGKANPVNGYISVHDNIADKGANFGRCNALGVLAGKVCASSYALIPSIKLHIDSCKSVGVDLEEDLDITPCIEEISCEAAGEC